ncbi:NAD(P)/FAD-dependent oxidoreductase [Tissierella creatinophila]|uniref:Putative thiazole biosynthetic enzyme n=1 Tax=Tissierella creatinophila DSM 6911 TaxID=1123403 RepID=A0A1U7M2N5_TISCR|nr:hypothetical protein [Tissierella creatinophila]OLS01479.1 putative thiazole biosynthetic enzyme [Tissierella creatinophila DSM 6911]
MIRVPEIKLYLEEDEEKLKELVSKKLNISIKDISEIKIFKKSIDARRKEKIHFVYTLDIEVKNEEKLLKRYSKKGVTKVKEVTRNYEFKERRDVLRPIVVGTGPSGLFAGLVLAKSGFKPILLERGKDVDRRAVDVGFFWNEGKLNPESNVQFGEGGAGTFSDGKLTTLVKDPRSRWILEEFVKGGAPEDILYINKPHIGTDILRNVVKEIRKTIISLGGEVRFESKVTDLIIKDKKIVGVKVNDRETIRTDTVLLALGHSARDTFEMLLSRGVEISQKSFSIGVRIEHPQNLINKNQYGEFKDHAKLGAAEYKLSGHFDNGRSAYSFCMCPGGMVISASSEEGQIVTNGMSMHSRDGKNANSALLVGVTPEDFESTHPLAGAQFQRKWESLAFTLGGSNYTAPAQRVGDFLEDRASTEIGSIDKTYTPGVKMTDLRKCLPDYVTDTLKMAIVEFDKKIKGFNTPDAIMTGVETRSSSPIRIQRGDSLESNIKGLYPVGEGAGYAGGIMSAAIDGIKVAEKIIN